MEESIVLNSDKKEKIWLKDASFKCLKIYYTFIEVNHKLKVKIKLG